MPNTHAHRLMATSGTIKKTTYDACTSLKRTLNCCSLIAIWTLVLFPVYNKCPAMWSIRTSHSKFKRRGLISSSQPELQCYSIVKVQLQ